LSTNIDAGHKFQLLVFSLLFAVILSYILAIGKSLILPIIIAIISVYVLVSASEWLGRQPVVGRFPEWVRRTLVLVSFTFGFITLVGVFISTSEQIMVKMPIYEENIINIFDDLAAMLGAKSNPDWAIVWETLISKIDLQSLAAIAFGSASAMAGSVFMVVIYAMFLMGERGGFAYKIATALPGDSAEQTQRLVQNINQSIGNYLAVKTLVNGILAAISYVILWFVDVDFAIFWAILIGLLNYIPYVGSLLGVMFPVALTMAQFGSVQTTLIAAITLFMAQTWVGNFLEPRMVGRSVNMSPFVVLVALTFWSTLWGIAGAVLAIPLTAVIIILMDNFAATRPFAILLADDVDRYGDAS
jgi:AI-2 transport protein TqsA